MTKILTMTREEANQRVAVLCTGITQLIADSGELVDLTMDALLSSYLTIAEQTGRIHEVPHVLTNVAQTLNQALNKGLIPPPSTTKH